MVHHNVLFGVSGLALVALLGLTIRLGILTNQGNPRVKLAEAARWSRLAAAYDEAAAQRQTAISAETARWTGLAELYAERTATRAHWNAVGANYTAQAIRLALETDNPSYMPKCVTADVLALLPPIGDDSWRATMPTCDQ